MARLERLLPEESPPRYARLFCYDDGRFVTLPVDEVVPAPPGVWDKRGGDAR